jgi:hypothetical protein
MNARLQPRRIFLLSLLFGQIHAFTTPKYSVRGLSSLASKIRRLNLGLIRLICTATCSTPALPSPFNVVLLHVQSPCPLSTTKSTLPQVAQGLLIIHSVTSVFSPLAPRTPLGPSTQRHDTKWRILGSSYLDCRLV